MDTMLLHFSFGVAIMLSSEYSISFITNSSFFCHPVADFIALWLP
jgi:hypothetical protein